MNDQTARNAALRQERERRTKSAWLNSDHRVIKSGEQISYARDPRFRIDLSRYATLSEDLTRVEQVWFSPVAELTVVDQDGNGRVVEVDVDYLTSLRADIDRVLPVLRYAEEHQFDRVQPLLLTEDEHGYLFNGDLDAGVRLARADRYVIERRAPSGRYEVLLCGEDPGDDRDPDELVDEFGVDEDMEKAWRYALGAFFGPPDDGYDDLRLRIALETGGF
jgi:hypothetical protein